MKHMHLIAWAFEFWVITKYGKERSVRFRREISKKHPRSNGWRCKYRWLRGQDLLKTLPLKNGFEVINGRATAVTCTLIM